MHLLGVELDYSEGVTLKAVAKYIPIRIALFLCFIVFHFLTIDKKVSIVNQYTYKVNKTFNTL